MRWVNVLVVALVDTVLGAAEDKGRAFHFSKDDVGNLPKGWTAAKTGEGEGSEWKVVADDTAPSGKGYALAQTAAGPNRLFNLCVADDTDYKDLEVRVRFKAMRGLSLHSWSDGTYTCGGGSGDGH